MAREILEDHLIKAERYVLEGERHITRQREIIERLERHGHDSGEAERLLCQFEALQALYVAIATGCAANWAGWLRRIESDHHK